MKQLIEKRQHREVLEIHNQFQSSGNITLNLLTLKSCVALNDIERGKSILSTFNVSKIRNISVLNQLLSFYCSFGDIFSTESLFQTISDRADIVTITIMMKHYVQCGHPQRALDLYDTSTLQKDDHSHLWALKSCEALCDLQKGQQIHNEIQHRLNENTHLRNALINMYGHCDALEIAESVFCSIPSSHRSIVSVCSMMSACVHCNEPTRALELYHELQKSQRDSICHESAIKAASAINTELQHNIFADIPIQQRTIGITNAMMKGCRFRNAHQMALDFYNEIADHQKDEFTHFLAVNSCIALEDYQRGVVICDLLRESDDTVNIELVTAMIVCYGKCGRIEDAVDIFEGIKGTKRNVVVINAMMEAFCDNERAAECIALFKEMNAENSTNSSVTTEPDIISFKIVLKACAVGTAFHFGDSVYALMDEKGILDDTTVDIGIWIHLINLYGKCGMMDRCEEIWDRVDGQQKRENLVLWNAMIRAFGRNGKLDEALDIYERINGECGLEGDRKTFIHLIGSCDHVGNVDKAMEIWESIGEEEIKYDTVVTNALIDCFARNGQIERAKTIMKQHGIESNEFTMVSLLSGHHKNRQVRETSFSDDTMCFESSKIVKK